LTWEVGPGCHLVVGPNGAGKTSLLEAVYLAATARSFRTSQLEDCARRDHADAMDRLDHPDGLDHPRRLDHPATATAETATAGGGGFVTRVEAAGPPLAELAVSWGEEGLTRTLDGKAVPLATYLGALPVVAWTSREDEILAGVPERRRRMIDAGLVAERAERVTLLARHRRVLAHKRELLRRRQPGLEAWNRLLAECGAELQRARADWVTRLGTRLAEALAAADRGFPTIAVRYEPSPPEGPEGIDALLRSLAEASADELRIGRPCIGPHLDRLSILWGGVDVSRVASAGERKALGLLLAAAQAALVADAGRAPTVLADDVDAELDAAALEAVWGVLTRGRQVLATTSRPETSERLEGVLEWGLEGGPTGLGPIRNQAR
jgi:DNA replication and repair protein RecF